MTATAHGGESAHSAAARLAAGSGVAALATTRSGGDPVAFGPVLHGLAGDGTLLVLAGGDAVPEAVGSGESTPQAVLMVDDYAPLLEARVHLGCLRARGRLRAARDDEFAGHPLRAEQSAWAGSRLLALEAPHLVLTRLGVSVELPVGEVACAEVDPLAHRAFELAEAVDGTRGIALADLVEEGDGPVRLLSLDTRGVHVLVEDPAGMGIHRVPFTRPVGGVGAAVDEVARLCGAGARR